MSSLDHISKEDPLEGISQQNDTTNNPNLISATPNTSGQTTQSGSFCDNLIKNRPIVCGAVLTISAPIRYTGFLLFTASDAINHTFKCISKGLESFQNLRNYEDVYQDNISIPSKVGSGISKGSQALLCTGPHMAIVRGAIASLGLIGAGMMSFGNLQSSRASDEITRKYQASVGIKTTNTTMPLKTLIKGIQLAYSDIPNFWQGKSSDPRRTTRKTVSESDIRLTETSNEQENKLESNE